MSKDDSKQKPVNSEPEGGTTENPSNEAPQESSTDWEAKATEYLNDLKRVQADFENYKKRQAKDQGEMTRFMIQGIVADLVPILDNFHAAVTHVPEGEKASPWVTGITYIEKQFEEVLGNYGVKPLDVKPGDPFDPTRHEAISNEQKTENNEHEAEKDTAHTISKVIQKGYMIGEKVIRAAKVIVQ